MASFATYQVIEGLWRLLTVEEQVVATNQLAFASAIIRQQVAGVDDLITAGTLDTALVGMVAASMVLRVMRNPDGYRSEQIDDYQYTRDQALSAGSLYLSDDELALLRGRRPRAFTIVPGAPDVSYAELEQVAAHRAAWGRACP